MANIISKILGKSDSTKEWIDATKYDIGATFENVFHTSNGKTFSLKDFYNNYKSLTNHLTMVAYSANSPKNGSHYPLWYDTSDNDSVQ